jgi:hypothetical protein
VRLAAPSRLSERHVVTLGVLEPCGSLQTMTSQALLIAIE